MSENVITIGKLKEVLSENEEKILDMLENTAFIEYSEVFTEETQEYLGPVYLEIYASDSEKDETAYNILANDIFGQDLDFSVEYKHDLFNNFLDKLNFILDDVFFTEEKLKDLCEDHEVNVDDFLENTSLYFGFGDNGIGLLVARYE